MAPPSVRSQAASILTTLHEHCLLVNVSFHRWTGQLVVRGASVRVPPVGRVAPPKIAPPHWRLEPDSLKKAIDPIEREVRAAVARCTRPFLFRGVHVLPMDRAAELFNQLATLREQLKDEVDRLVRKGYSKLLGEIRDRIGDDAFAEVEPYIPDPETMSSRFGLEWSAFGLPTQAPQPSGSGEITFLKEAEERFAQNVVDLVENDPAIQKMLHRPAPKPVPARP